MSDVSSGINHTRTRQLEKRQPGALAQGTLGRRLVIRVTTLIAAAALGLSALSLVAIYAFSIDRKGSEVRADARRDFELGGVLNERRARAEYRNARELGSVSVVQMADGSVQGLIVKSDRVSDLSPEARERLMRVPVKNGMYTVTLPGLTTYYVFAGDRMPKTESPPDDQNLNDPTYVPPKLVITGRPLAAVHTLLGRMAMALLSLAMLAIIGSIFAVRSVVVTSLRPLNRLAATADEVAKIQLERGDVGLTVRVDEDDANPNNEVGRVGAAFNRMLSHVEKALAARQASEMKVRRFVADASHELRNPLAAIRGYAEITRRQRADLPPDSAFAMGRIEAESERMSSLVEDMLLLARLDNNPELDLESIDLNETLIHAVADAGAAGPHHIWLLDLPGVPVEAIVDRHRFHQVVVNLLTNARVHTPEGTKVTASLRKNGDRATITIADNGPGIPKDMQGKVFERFVRADAARARTGSASTGLGLAIVASVVEANGGTVRVESKPGDTRFMIDLPLDGPYADSQLEP